MIQAAAQQTANPTTAAEVLGASPVTANGSPPSAPVAADAPGSDKISGKVQLLIQREKSAVERERAAKAKEAALEARESAFAAREAKLDEFENLKKTNPTKALEMLGLSYQELTQIIMADGAVTPDVQVRRLEDKLSTFEKSLEAEKRQAAEDAKKQEERQHSNVLDRFKGDIATYLKDNATRYELIEFEQSQDLVYEVIEEHYSRTLAEAKTKAEEEGTDPESCRGEQLTIAQAADKIELHLEQKYDKARSLKKVTALHAPRTVTFKPKTEEKQKTQTRQTPQTLNNQLSARPTPPASRPITDDERVAKAIAYARGLRPQA